MWTSLNKLIYKKSKSLAFKKAIAFSDLQLKWDEIIGESIHPDFSKKSKPYKIESKTIMVDCLNSVWANEFQFKEENILNKIKEKFELEVEKIRFVS